MFKGILEETADMIEKRGALVFKPAKWKIHERKPKAPLAPYYFNLRAKDNPKPGPLLAKDCELIVKCFFRLIRIFGLSFSAIAGIPRAGDPYLEAIKRITSEPRRFRIIPLDKAEKDEGRKIILKTDFKYRQGEVVLLLDNVIAQADTKVEAIQALRSAGCVVNDIITLIDLEQGGRERIKEMDCRVFSVFVATDILNYYRSLGKITESKYQECMRYWVGP